MYAPPSEPKSCFMLKVDGGEHGGGAEDECEDETEGAAAEQ